MGLTQFCLREYMNAVLKVDSYIGFVSKLTKILIWHCYHPLWSWKFIFLLCFSLTQSSSVYCYSFLSPPKLMPRFLVMPSQFIMLLIASQWWHFSIVVCKPLAFFLLTLLIFLIQLSRKDAAIAIIPPHLG